MYSRILVALAFDELSEKVAEHALAFAAAVEPQDCVLLHVVESIEGEIDSQVSGFYSDLETTARSRLKEVADRFRAEGVPVEERVAVGHRWKEILAVAEDRRSNLIILGSRGTVQGGRPHLGTTSHRVFFGAVAPLLVIRS